jgi:hypothetical protein
MLGGKRFFHSKRKDLNRCLRVLDLQYYSMYFFGKLCKIFENILKNERLGKKILKFVKFFYINNHRIFTLFLFVFFFLIEK